MKKPYHATTEHYLVPAVLFLLNICLAHVIYAFIGESPYNIAGKALLVLAFVGFIISLSFKKQALLGGAMLFYALVVMMG